jgi:hypothetical protein
MACVATAALGARTRPITTPVFTSLWEIHEVLLQALKLRSARR